MPLLKGFIVITELNFAITSSLIIEYQTKVFLSNYIGLKLGSHQQMAKNSSIKDEAAMDRSLATKLSSVELMEGYLYLALYLRSGTLFLVFQASHFPACNASSLCLPTNFLDLLNLSGLNDLLSTHVPILFGMVINTRIRVLFSWQHKYRFHYLD